MCSRGLCLLGPSVGTGCGGEPGQRRRHLAVVVDEVPVKVGETQELLLGGWGWPLSHSLKQASQNQANMLYMFLPRLRENQNIIQIDKEERVAEGINDKCLEHGLVGAFVSLKGITLYSKCSIGVLKAVFSSYLLRIQTG